MLCRNSAPEPSHRPRQSARRSLPRRRGREAPREDKVMPAMFYNMLEGVLMDLCSREPPGARAVPPIGESIKGT